MKEQMILTPMSQCGDRVKWETIGGDSFVGTLVEWDSNVAIIQLDDGRRKAVEC